MDRQVRRTIAIRPDAERRNHPGFAAGTQSDAVLRSRRARRTRAMFPPLTGSVGFSLDVVFARRHRRHTQTSVAHELGISQDAISRLEQRSYLLLSTLRKKV